MANLILNLHFVISQLKVIYSVQFKNLCWLLFLAEIRKQRSRSLKIPSGYPFTVVFHPPAHLNKILPYISDMRECLKRRPKLQRKTLLTTSVVFSGGPVSDKLKGWNLFVDREANTQ